MIIFSRPEPRLPSGRSSNGLRRLLGIEQNAPTIKIYALGFHFLRDPAIKISKLFKLLLYS